MWTYSNPEQAYKGFLQERFPDLPVELWKPVVYARRTITVDLEYMTSLDPGHAEVTMRINAYRKGTQDELFQWHEAIRGALMENAVPGFNLRECGFFSEVLTTNDLTGARLVLRAETKGFSL